MSKTEQLREQILSQNPTKEQKDAIFTEELEFLLRASPGSGKTWTSCRRFIWRGANWGYKAGGLALLSFTNVAIREFHDATIKVGKSELLSDPNYVGTFDSFIERFIITPFGHLFKKLPKRPTLFIAPRPGDRANNKLKTKISISNKLRDIYAWEIIPYRINKQTKFCLKERYGIEYIVEYGEKVIENFFSSGFYSHSQRAYLAYKIFSTYPNIVECLSRRFPEIIVDEAQDTNPWFLILLDILRKKGSKITLIGDPDQCIYEFNMANSNYLPMLKNKWKIPEKPLRLSFRCNNLIAESVSNINGNTSFLGCGINKNEFQKPFIIRESNSDFTHSIAEFERLLNNACISLADSAILCRAHHELDTIRGKINYTKLQGLTKTMAQAAFFRDVHKDYKKTFKLVENVIREITPEYEFWNFFDNNSESYESQKVRLTIWKFIKSKDGLPPLTENCDVWVEKLKINLTKIINKIGFTENLNLGKKIRRMGLDKGKFTSPLFQPHTLFPQIRQETIHQVKGESIEGVLLLGAAKFFNSVVKAVESHENTEDRRIAYVAMTRARHVLLIGLPASHYDKHLSSWMKWGFKILP